MVSGLSVVAYDYAAAAQHLHHDKSGLLAAYGQTDKFATGRRAGRHPCQQSATLCANWQERTPESGVTGLEMCRAGNGNAVAVGCLSRFSTLRLPGALFRLGGKRNHPATVSACVWAKERPEVYENSIFNRR